MKNDSDFMQIFDEFCQELDKTPWQKDPVVLFFLWFVGITAGVVFFCVLCLIVFVCLFSLGG